MHKITLRGGLLALALAATLTSAIFLATGAIHHDLTPRLDSNLTDAAALGAWVLWVLLGNRAAICADVDRLRLLHAARATAPPAGRLRLVSALTSPARHPVLRAARNLLWPGPCILLVVVAVLVVIGLLAPDAIVPAANGAPAPVPAATVTITTTVAPTTPVGAPAAPARPPATVAPTTAPPAPEATTSPAGRPAAPASTTVPAAATTTTPDTAPPTSAAQTPAPVAAQTPPPTCIRHQHCDNGNGGR